jgi:hypothetical protein
MRFTNRDVAFGMQAVIAYPIVNTVRFLDAFIPQKIRGKIILRRFAVDARYSCCVTSAINRKDGVAARTLMRARFGNSKRSVDFGESEEKGVDASRIIGSPASGVLG